MNFKLVSVLATCLMVIGCGQQQKPNDTVDEAQSNENLFQGPLNDATRESLWQSVDKQGVISDGPLAGTTAFTVNQKSNSVSFDIPLFKGDTSGKKTIPGLEGANIEIIKGMFGAKTARLNIPLKHFSTSSVSPQGSVSIIDPTKLPNGDPLPGIPGGELPKIAIGYPVDENVDLYVYLASKYIGIFAATKNVNPYVKMTYPIKDMAQTKIVGYFSTVPAKGNHSGGFWLSMVIPPELQRLIEDMLN